MAAAKPPVAIRITRPYQSEDEFLANELETISRTGVTLVGAQPRPDGAVLRFEIALASGAPLLRGEGRVVGYKEGVHGGEGGLALRFTRLDSKSKALVDRVGVMRDAKRSVPPQRPASVRPRGVPPPLPPAARRSAAPPPLSRPPPPVPSAPSETSIPEIPVSTSDVMPKPAPVSAPVAEPVAAPVQAPEPAEPVAVSARTPPSAPDRDAALDRLRKRTVDPSEVAKILEQGASRRR